MNKAHHDFPRTSQEHTELRQAIYERDREHLAKLEKQGGNMSAIEFMRHRVKQQEHAQGKVTGNPSTSEPESQSLQPGHRQRL